MRYADLPVGQKSTKTLLTPFVHLTWPISGFLWMIIGRQFKGFTMTHYRLNGLPNTIYWKSNFNFRHVRLLDLNIPRENGLTICKQWRP